MDARADRADAQRSTRLNPALPGLVLIMVVVSMATISSLRFAKGATDGEPLQTVALGSLPLSLPQHRWRPLRATLHPRLQERLESALLAEPHRAHLIRSQKLAVGLVDLSRPTAVRFAMVNGDTMFYAASLPKIAILLAAFQAIRDGSLEQTPGLITDLEAMIRRSSNESATRMIQILGFDRVRSVLTDDRYKLYDPARGGGLWVGRAYATYSARHPDPLRGISHGATALQVCRFYYLLANGRLIDRDCSRQMLALLSEPALHHKFVHSLKDSTRLSRVYRKSGTWRQWHSDSALVWQEDGRRYILAALSEDEQGERTLRDLIPLAEAVLRDISSPLGITRD